ncbi:MAG TPA: hypothetical protein PLP05_09600 [Sedimentisphaerales bacterium]|nr:hypothetical protein [Sedimentisphaerales bacterium]
MKKIGIVFLGLVTIAAIIIFVPMALDKFFPHTASDKFFPHDERLSYLITFLIIMPIIFLVGSVVTGYFSYYEVESKWGLIWLAPILYFNLIYIGVTFAGFLLQLFVDAYKPSNAGFLSWFFGILIGVYWYLASLAGVLLGYFIRSRILSWWYGD